MRLADIIAEELAKHRQRSIAGPYLAQCTANDWAGKPEEHEAHQAEIIEARFGVRVSGNGWGNMNAPAKPVVIRMPADLHAAVKAKAAAEERSMAQAIRHALRIYVGTAAP